MKVNIRAYSPDLISTNRLERRYERMREETLGLTPFSFDEEHYNTIDKIVLKLLEVISDVARPINNAWRWLFPEKYKVKVDYVDIWDASVTLAHIIVPVLKKLEEHKQGSPVVDPEDVPEHLRPTEEAGPDNGYTDNTVHIRWEWVIDEMIWAFEQSTKDWECQYFHNSDQLSMSTESIEGKKVFKFNHQKDPSKPKYYRDDKGIEAHRARMDNGRRLFAKYYEGLWD